MTISLVVFFASSASAMRVPVSSLFSAFRVNLLFAAVRSQFTLRRLRSI
jgi:hypothetical protein